MNLDTLLQPVSLIYLVSFIFSILSPHNHRRRHMMAFKSVGDGLGSIYYALIGGYSAAAAALIPAISSLVQAITPDNHLETTKKHRLAFAIFLAFISIILVYRSPIDILPIGAVVASRFGELQRSAQKIRIVYATTAIAWIFYHIGNDFYLALIVQTLSFFSLILSIIRHHHPAPKENSTKVN